MAESQSIGGWEGSALGELRLEGWAPWEGLGEGLEESARSSITMGPTSGLGESRLYLSEEAASELEAGALGERPAIDELSAMTDCTRGASDEEPGGMPPPLLLGALGLWAARSLYPGECMLRGCCS